MYKPMVQRRTIETRVTWAYTRVGLYMAVYGNTVGCNLFLICISLDQPSEVPSEIDINYLLKNGLTI